LCCLNAKDLNVAGELRTLQKNGKDNSTREKHNVAGLSACGSPAQAGHSVASQLRTLQKKRQQKPLFI
jgi:hypothetical protein